MTVEEYVNDLLDKYMFYKHSQNYEGIWESERDIILEIKCSLIDNENTISALSMYGIDDDFYKKAKHILTKKIKSLRVGN